MLQSGAATHHQSQGHAWRSSSSRGTSSILCAHKKTAQGWKPQPASSDLHSTAAKSLSPFPCLFQLPLVLHCVEMPKQWCKRQQQQSKERNSQSAQESKPIFCGQMRGRTTPFKTTFKHGRVLGANVLLCKTDLEQP